jgi:hypothetical protein
MKSKFLVFETNHHAQYMSEEVKNGGVSIGDKEWFVDKAKPILLEKKGFFSRWFGGEAFTPLYFLKWNILLPVDWEYKEKKMKFNELLASVKDEETRKKLEEIAKEDDKVKDSTWMLKELVPVSVLFPKADAKEDEFAVTPEFIKSTADMRFLKNMKNYAGGEGGSKFTKKRIMDILFVGGMIVLVFVSLAITGVIK